MRHTDRIRNGLSPDWRMASAVARRLNFANARMRKLVFCKSTYPGAAPQGSDGQLVPWRWRFLTGPKHDNDDADLTMRVWMSLLPADTASILDPRARVATTAGNTDYRRYPLSDTSPSFGQLVYTFVDLTGLAAETTIDCALEIEDNARVMSLSAYIIAGDYVDTASTATVVDSRLYAHEAEVTDAQHSQLVTDVGHRLWRMGGSHLFNLVPETETDIWTRTSSTFANVLESGASTTVSSSTPGFNLGVDYHNPMHSNTFRCTFAAYGRNTTSSGGQVRLADATNGTLATLSSFNTTGEWKSTAVNIDATDPKVDVQFAGDNTNTFNLHAVSVYCEGA